MSHLRIALIESSEASTHVFSRTYLPRTGIPTLGAVLKNLGYECDIWFESHSPIPVDKLREYDIVGIGSITGTIQAAYRMADSLKGSGPFVVMGGPHVTFMPEEALEHCDYVVMGEGEIPFSCPDRGHRKQGVAGRYPGPGIPARRRHDPFNRQGAGCRFQGVAVTGLFPVPSDQVRPDPSHHNDFSRMPT